jgi:arylsulfatase A-like enzyme
MDGVDLMPLLMGDTTQRPHPTLYWRFGTQWAIRDGDLKLVHFDGSGEKLFDLSKDPGEKHDLAAAQSDNASRLRSQWQSWSAELMEPRWKNKAKFEEKLDSMSRQESGKGARVRRRRRESPATQAED